MYLTKPVKQAHNYKEDRNRLIVFLMKCRGWSAGEVQKDALARQYGHKISRIRVGQIYEAYKRKYTVRSFKNYEAPESL